MAGPPLAGLQLLADRLVSQKLDQQFGISGLQKVAALPNVGEPMDDTFLNLEPAEVSNDAAGVVQRYLSGDQRTQRWLMQDTGSDYEKSVRAQARNLLLSSGNTPEAPILNANDPRALAPGGAVLPVGGRQEPGPPEPKPDVVPPPPPKPEPDILDTIRDALTTMGRGNLAPGEATRRARDVLGFGPESVVPATERSRSPFTPPPVEGVRDVDHPPGFFPTPTEKPVPPPEPPVSIPPSPAVAAAKGEESRARPDYWLPLATMGFAMGASNSPFFGQALSQGGLAGLEAFAKERAFTSGTALKKKELELDERRARAAEITAEASRTTAEAAKRKAEGLGNAPEAIQKYAYLTQMFPKMSIEDRLARSGLKVEDITEDAAKMAVVASAQNQALGMPPLTLDALKSALAPLEQWKKERGGKTDRIPNVGEVRKVTRKDGKLSFE